jgi:hypothetical protein
LELTSGLWTLASLALFDPLAAQLYALGFDTYCRRKELVRYTVLEAGEPIGHVEVPEHASDDGFAFGDLESLPTFERLRPVLEAAARAQVLMWERVEAARREGRLPPAPPPAQGVVIMGKTSEAELAVWGEDVHAARAARARLVFSLADAAGRPVPTEDVQVEARTFPGHPYPPQPPLVVVMFPVVGQPREAEA